MANMISLKETATICQLLTLICAATIAVHARSIAPESDVSVSAVIPSPNQDFGDIPEYAELQRTSASSSNRRQLLASSTGPMSFSMAPSVEPQASNEKSVPVYVSPFNRADIGTTPLVAAVAPVANFDHSDESSHAPPNYAPRPAGPSASGPSSDLKTSASYGHHHHGGHHGYGPSGWLDMGAWTGGKGSFGWYADYPVGGKHHGYGRK